MKPLYRRAVLLLALVSLAACNAKTTTAKPDKAIESFEVLQDDYYDDDSKEEILFNEDKPCPRDCICTSTPGAKIARCSRLEVGTQKFGEDITGLAIENVDSKHPLILSDMMFKKLGLHSVQNIKIVDSFILSISPTAFHGLHQLYSVNLTSNNIQVLHPNTFAYNDKLTLLSLGNNPLMINKLGPNDHFLNSTPIQELDLSGCGIKSIPRKTFSKLGSLLYINLSKNKLQDLDPSIFENLIDLEEVDLSNNFIQTIPQSLFANNNEMATLKIGDNPLNSVIGLKIEELMTLDLGVAKIKNIGPSMFDGMNFISNLNLSGNGIEKIHNQAFHKLRELNYLDLSNNKMDYISDLLIKENFDLDVFKIANNPLLKSLPEHGFQCTSSKFNIYLFDASGCSFETLANDTFKTMPALSQLDLSHNKLRDIGFSLHHTSNLIELDLSYNMITFLQLNTFENTNKLNKINLAGNPLATLSSRLFANTPVLVRMDVSSCQLSKIWDSSEIHEEGIVNSLSFLNASNNQLKSVNIDDLKVMTKLSTLDITQNPLQCSTEFDKLTTWLESHKISPFARDALAANLEMTDDSPVRQLNWEFLIKQTCGDKTIKIDEKADDDSEKDEVEEDDYYEEDLEEGDSEDDEDTTVLPKADKKKPKIIQVEKLKQMEDESGKFDFTDLDINNKMKKDKGVVKSQSISASKSNFDFSDLDINSIMKKEEYHVEKTSASPKIVEDDFRFNKIIEKEDNSEKSSSSESEAKFFFNDLDLIGKLKKSSSERTQLSENQPRFDFDDLDVNKKIKYIDVIEPEQDYVTIESSTFEYHNSFLNMVPPVMSILVLLFAILKLVKMCRERQVRRGVIIAVTAASQGKVKKDCGLVYQQLSEDLPGPKTPIISRQIYSELSPFHQKNIHPESV